MKCCEVRHHITSSNPAELPANVVEQVQEHMRSCKECQEHIIAGTEELLAECTEPELEGLKEYANRELTEFKEKYQGEKK